jgi:ATP-dependent DNA helicase DinG
MEQGLPTAVEFLKDPSRFAAHLPGFRPRQSQLEMAEAVADAIASRNTLVVEAETGTGKTLAYLLPALLSEGPTLISTGTKSLQDQLFFKDLPLVVNVLGISRRVALLKGRANYLCPHRLELANSGTNSFMMKETHHQLTVVTHWAQRTKTGDLAELKELPEDAPVWPWVTSTRENCLGQDCPLYSDCPLMKARKKAQEADLVVVNHHLFFADAALREEGIQAILPDVKTVVFDEAHQLPDVAANFFGRHLTAGQLKELARDGLMQAAGVLPKNKLKEATDKVQKAASDLRLALGDDGRRDPWQKVAGLASVQRAVAALGQSLDDLHALLEPVGKSSRDLENCLERCADMRELLAYLVKAADTQQVFWFENFSKSFVMHATPLSVAGIFGRQREQLPAAWIFTSATLSVNGDFSHFSNRLGLAEARTLALASPFDFRHQSLLYVPEGLPDPNAMDYTDELVAKVLPVIEAAGGRTFFLFTSHRALKRAAQLLEGQCRFPLLVQNTLSRRQLLDDFRKLGNAVLLGSASFWEGIDVRGETLSCVIIDKLPFASPGDPVMAARMDRCREDEGNPFFDLQLPAAVLSLRQGAGRLIRDVNDTGVLVLCDPRVISKSYGKKTLDSLPPMPRTRQLEVVERFFRHKGERAVTNPELDDGAGQAICEEGKA